MLEGLKKWWNNIFNKKEVKKPLIVPKEETDNFDLIYRQLENKLNAAFPLKNTVQLIIDGKYIHINGNGSANSLSKIQQNSDCTINISQQKILEILKNESPIMLLLQKDVKVDGNIGVAMKFQSILVSI